MLCRGLLVRARLHERKSPRPRGPEARSSPTKTRLLDVAFPVTSYVRHSLEAQVLREPSG